LKSHKSLLAKLLANEDVNVEVAAAATASFNPVTRTIRIPAWKDISNDTHDLLLGHEVGHALYTPTEGWHDAVHNYDFPKAYANIVEDIRIEKSIQSRYPGLRNNFIGGYKELLERDFFGINGTDINAMSFMNRLNVKSKCRDLVDVKFSKEEMLYVKKVYACNDFDEVIDVCVELHEWLKAKNEKAKEPEAQPEPEAEETCETPAEEGDTDQVEEETTEGSDTDEEEETEEEAKAGVDDEESEADADAESEETEETDNTTEEQGDEETDSDELGDDDEEPLDEDFDYTDAETDNTFRENEESLGTDDKNEIPTVVNIPVYSELKKHIVSWERARELRAIKFEKLKNTKTYTKPGHYNWSNNCEKRFVGDYYDAEFNIALKSANENAEALVKEFERKKSAWQSQRSQESRKGSLNMSKLHNYKFSDDIFMSNINMPNYKSHGLVSLIDFSGSMHGNMITTITQAYVLAAFAKRVNIPFNICSFTSSRSASECFDRAREKQPENDLDMKDILMVEQFTDQMNKAAIVDTFKTLWKTYQESSYTIAAPCDTLGGTPLDGSIAAMVSVIDNFKTKNRLQKVSFITINDGDTSPSIAHGLWGGAKSRLYYKNKFIAELDWRSYKKNSSNGIIDNLTNCIKDLGDTTVGFYITRNIRQEYYSTNLAACPKARKTFNESGIVKELDKDTEYDAYYFMKALPKLDDGDDFSNINENSKKADLNKALKSMGKNRIFTRVFAKTLAEAIA